MIRRALAAIAIAGGLLAAAVSAPRTDVDRLAKTIAAEEDHVTAMELAGWIRDRKDGLRVIDLRTADAFATYRIPRSERIALEAVASTPFGPHETIVLISDGGAHAAQAWVLLQARGHRNVFFLRGGMQEWLGEVMSPRKSSDLTDYFGGVPRGDGTPADAAAMRRRGC